MNGGDEHASFSVVGETDIRPVLQSTFYSGPQPLVRQQPFGRVGHKDRVSDIRNAGANFFHRQVVGQMAGTDEIYSNVLD